MKKILVYCILCQGFLTQAQTNFEKTIPTKPGQTLVIHFDYPEVRLQTWDKNEVLIKGTVSINRGENNDAFGLDVNVSSSEITVTSVIKDKVNIPQRIVIKKGDSEFMFKASDFNDPEVQKFLEENNHEYSYMSSGIVKEIKLEVFVPKKLETRIDSKYGLVEVKDFQAPLTIDAKYGGIDATIFNTTGDLTARTRFGEILTNLNVKFDQIRSSADGSKGWTEIKGKPGSGPAALFESKYGNVYLRKPN